MTIVNVWHESCRMMIFENFFFLKYLINIEKLQLELVAAKWQCFGEVIDIKC